MTLILFSNLFGEGLASSDMVQIAIMLAGAFALGFLFRWALRAGDKAKIKKLKDELKTKEEEFIPIEKHRAISTLETKIAHLEQRNSDLRILLTTAETAAVKAESLTKKNLELEKKNRELELKLNGNSPSPVTPNTESPRETVYEQPEKVEEPSFPSFRQAPSSGGLVEDPTDLKKIEGIGPKIHEILSAAGINTFDDLAQSTAHELRKILLDQGPKYKAHDPETWPRQAQMARDGKWEALLEWQSKLKGGKIVKDENDEE
ncbi:MAG: hypothetical protein GC181_01080 [Bacteroidetes bacterium]|nr:hypothetical protein [Bacteroidota bacterium]